MKELNDVINIDMTYRDLFLIYITLGKFNSRLKDLKDKSLWEIIKDNYDLEGTYDKYFISKSPDAIKNWFNYDAEDEEIMQVFNSIFNAEYEHKQKELDKLYSKQKEIQSEIDKLEGELK